MIQADTNESARPSHPICSSQSFRFQIREEGVPSGTVRPGTKTSATTKMTTMGTPELNARSMAELTVSFSVTGKLGRFSRDDNTDGDATRTKRQLETASANSAGIGSAARCCKVLRPGASLAKPNQATGRVGPVGAPCSPVASKVPLKLPSPPIV
ncbi:hypothetical protein NUW58_g9973 [Xylaria curta]|uniref:Uncharacterized protein n=1 Tax=Xylaria curta TaxID=42375 RepID=A0ACC1MS64_9PEZI|nr:hypothetical protein NUW58_g9973 [Xylaria curta]